MNEEKTVEGEERAIFVTGVNCNRDTAFQEMQSVKERFGKTGGNVAYHAYQSFRPGGVTPELYHRLGVELAKRMWGDEYQVFVATHFNTGTYHNHFVVNSVGLWDGRKFNCSKRAYYQFRQLSDDLCKEYQLSTIKNPKGKTAPAYPCNWSSGTVAGILDRQEYVGDTVNFRTYRQSLSRKSSWIGRRRNGKYSFCR